MFGEDVGLMAFLRANIRNETLGRILLSEPVGSAAMTGFDIPVCGLSRRSPASPADAENRRKKSQRRGRRPHGRRESPSGPVGARPDRPAPAHAPSPARRPRRVNYGTRERVWTMELASRDAQDTALVVVALVLVYSTR